MLPILETERLLLKEVGMEHLPEYKKYFMDYEVIRTLSATVPWPYPDDGIENYLNEHILPNQGKDRWIWGIFRKEAPEHLIGIIELRRERDPENRGFWLGRPFWGKGYMTEANIAVLNCAFDILGFEELYFGNAVQNVGSRRIKEKTGATLYAGSLKARSFANR